MTPLDRTLFILWSTTNIAMIITISKLLTHIDILSDLIANVARLNLKSHEATQTFIENLIVVLSANKKGEKKK